MTNGGAGGGVCVCVGGGGGGFLTDFLSGYEVKST